jgi:hypothetical protein
MPCDTKLKPKQTIQQRADEVRKVVSNVNSLIASGKVKPIIDKLTGAIAFQGIDDTARDGVTDACVYRRLMATGSALAKAAIARAEQIAGRSVNKTAVAQGHHSHDGGKTWHHGH